MGKDDQGLNSGVRRYQVIPRVLVFLRNDSDVLLIEGVPEKRIWANQFNGVGGHVERDEDVLSAAKREVFEETGFEPTGLELRALVNIDAGDPSPGILMFVFTGWSLERRTRKSDEGELHWVPTDELEQYNLVEDLDWLLPRVLNAEQQSRPLYLHYSYDDDAELVIDERF